MKSHIIWAVLLVLAVCAGLEEARQHAVFERKAEAAEAFVKADSVIADSLERVALAWKAKAQASDSARTVVLDRRRQRVLVLPLAPVDDTICERIVAQRDTIIAQDAAIFADDDRKLAAWDSAFTAISGTLSHVTQERDSLGGALKARPRTVAFDLLHPRIQISAVLMLVPVTRVGIGISIPLVSIKL